MNLKKMISATYKKAAIGISILMFATSAGYTFNPVEVKADDEKPAMNVEYHSKQDIVDYYNKHPFDGIYDHLSDVSGKECGCAETDRRSFIVCNYFRYADVPFTDMYSVR